MPLKTTLDVQIGRNATRDFTGSPIELTFVNSDSALIMVKFKDLDPDTSQFIAKNFLLDGGTPLGLRVTVRADRDSASNLYTFQDVYNNGDWASFEDLTAGQVTWLVSWNSTNLNTAIAASSDNKINAWLEISYLDGNNVASTLLQTQIVVYNEVDDGAAGTPPPSSPTYLTAAEIAAAYFGKNDTMFWGVLSATTTTPPALASGEDKYIIPAGATGAWSGHTGKVAVDDGSWTLYTPAEGWSASVVDTGIIVQYISSAWATAGDYLVRSGEAGGQIAYGGTAAGDDLTLRSTSHATKGDVSIAGVLVVNEATTSMAGTGNLNIDTGATSVQMVFDDTAMPDRFQFVTAGNPLDSFLKITGDTTRGAHCTAIAGALSTDLNAGFGRTALEFTGADFYLRSSSNSIFRVSTSAPANSIFINSNGALLVNTLSQVASEDLTVADGANIAGTTVLEDVSITGSVKKAIVAKSANYTILDDDGVYTIEVTTAASDITITLPTASANSGRVLNIVKVDSGVGKVIIDGEGAETISGAATQEILNQWDARTLQCNGTSWTMIGAI